MLDISFITIFVIFLLFIFIILEKSKNKILSINIISISTISLILFSYIGLLPLYFQWDDYRVATGITNKLLVFKILIISGLAILFFLFGVVLTQAVLRTPNKPLLISQSTNIIRTKNSEVFFLIIFLIGALLVLFLYLHKIEDIALITALKKGIAEANIARSKMGNDFSGKYHWYKLFMNDMAIFISFSLFASQLVTKKYIIKILFLWSFIQCTFVLTMATEKAPFIYYILGLFMIKITIKSQSEISIKKLLLPVSLTLSFLITFYLLFTNTETVLSALSSVFSRAFSGSIAPSYFYLEYYPDHHDFLWGRTLPNPGHILPYTPIRYTVDIMNWKFPYLKDLGIIGSAPMAFWGEAYANFGLLGIPFIAIFLGSYIAIFNYAIQRLKPTPMVIGFYIWSILFFKDISTSGFSNFLYNIYLTLISFVFLLILMLTNKGIIKLKESM